MGGAADEDDLVDVGLVNLRVAVHLFNGLEWNGKDLGELFEEGKDYGCL